uniref:Putative receptor expression-enhancing protein 2 n=1 Tax=Panstrongylus lignarius TaxID=156445 RepID=A0A224X9Y0_9HEMI
MITAMISRLMILAFGTLYPAYASYKAVRTKDVKEYVKWMMYWIVFALFTCAETFTDVFFSFWFPFYYEIKVALVFWLLSPATKGSSFLYRNFVHPALQRRESEIDEMLSHAKEKGYNTVLSIGSKGVTYATNVLLQTAMRGGGGLVEHIKKSYSLTDLAPKVTPTPNTDTTDVAPGVSKSFWGMCLESLGLTGGSIGKGKSKINQANIVAPLNDILETSRQTRGRRGIAGSAANLEMRFSEVDVNIRQCPTNDILSDIRSSEDISSGYSSTDQLYTEGVLTRSSSVSSTRARGRGGRTAQTRRAPLTENSEGSDDESESITTTSCYPKNFSQSDTQVPTPQVSSPSLNKSQQNELSKKVEDKEYKGASGLSPNMAVISEDRTENNIVPRDTVDTVLKNDSQDTEVSHTGKDELKNNHVLVGNHSDVALGAENLTGAHSADVKEQDIASSHADISVSNKLSRSDLSSTNNDRFTREEEQEIVTKVEVIAAGVPSLQKCSSQISVASVSSVSSSSDSERKGKYKKLPAPSPPSREVDTVREVPDLEQKLSDTEALMKKINAVNVQEVNPANSDIKETLV